MVTPLQIDQYTRDGWGAFMPLGIKQLEPIVRSRCYKPKLYVGLDAQSQAIPGMQKSAYALTITPGSLIYGFYMGYVSASAFGTWAFQMTDTATGKKLWSSPVSQVFLSSNMGGGNVLGTGNPLDTPCLLVAPYPVVGRGVFEIEVWNQISTAQTIVPVIGVFEVED